jgi:hypothetical protein
MAEQTTIPVSELVVGDRVWMGGSRLWATVQTVTAAVEVTVVYDEHTRPVPFTRPHDFQVLVDREVPS